MSHSHARRECFKALDRIIGHKGIPAFLRGRQPALQDRTGQQLLEQAPAELMERLHSLEAQATGEGWPL